ncbi:hypothetical protein MPER_14956, partial [Moniliophthora perniciosa FA553]
MELYQHELGYVAVTFGGTLSSLASKHVLANGYFLSQIAILYLNIATTILEIQAMRSYFWEIFENEKTMQAVSPFLPAHLLVSTLTTFLVEIFFAFRLFLLKYEIHPSIPLMI